MGPVIKKNKMFFTRICVSMSTSIKKCCRTKHSCNRLASAQQQEPLQAHDRRMIVNTRLFVSVMGYCGPAALANKVSTTSKLFVSSRWSTLNATGSHAY